MKDGKCVSVPIAEFSKFGSFLDFVFGLQDLANFPVIENLTVNPEEPEASQEVRISFDIHEKYHTLNETFDAEFDAESAWILYSIDDGYTWDSTPMEIEDYIHEDYIHWTGMIPGFRAGTKVRWLIKFQDFSENTYTEEPCFVEDLSPEGKWPLEHRCLTAGIAEPSDLEEKAWLQTDDLDITEIKTGESENYIYVQLKVKGMVSQGSSKPINIQGYGGLFKFSSDINPIPIDSPGIFFLYSPLLKLANFDSCNTALKRGGALDYGKNGIDCYAEGQYVMFKLDKNYFEASIDHSKNCATDNCSWKEILSGNNFFQVAGITASCNSIQPFRGTVWDKTPVTRLWRIQRSYQVK